MKKVQISDVKAYEAPGHFGMTAMRLQGTEETGATKFWMGLSHFLPGGGAGWAYEDNPLEKIYFVLEGELTVTSKTETFVLRKGDSLFLGPNEGRELINATNMPASMLVVINYPD
jgi:quercetin dioxygenase-like cupin family protein